MSYKRKNYFVKPITYFVFAGIGLILLIIAGFNLLQNDLIVFTPTGESTFEITEAGSYYILVDTEGLRYQTNLEEVGVTNQVTISDKEDNEVYKASLILRGDSDTGATEVTNVEFDKQVRHREYLSFGKVSLKKDTYTFNGVEINENDDFGDYALLSMSYVNKIGLFSLSAVTTLLLSLLGFKYLKEARNIPMSKYQKKHRVK